MKYIISYVLALSTVILFAGCSKKQPEQNITQNKDSLQTSQKIAFDVKTVTKDNLPQSIKDYISANYKNHKITDAASDPLCKGGDAIDVAVEDADKKVLSLIFKPDGTYIQKEEDVEFKTAPDKVKEVIRIKYNSYKAGDQIEKLTLADNTIQYMIDIEKSGKSKEVILTPDGQIICEN